MRIASYVDVVPDLRAMAEKGGMMGSILGERLRRFGKRLGTLLCAGK